MGFTVLWESEKIRIFIRFVTSHGDFTYTGAENIGGKPDMDLNRAAELAAKRASDLGQIVGTEDGQKVKSMMEQDAPKLKQAMQAGDMSALKQTFDSLMQTEEGVRLIGSIQEIMKNSNGK